MWHVRDIFSAIAVVNPYFSVRDEAIFADYEARNGKYAPMGSVTLEEHDLLHILLGVDLVAFDSHAMRKHGENYLSGFTYGAEPKFTGTHKDQFYNVMLHKFPTPSQPDERGEQSFNLGFKYGQLWYKEIGQPQNIVLEKLLQQAVQENWGLPFLFNAFWSSSMTETENQILGERGTHLNQTRRGVAETFGPRTLLTIPNPAYIKPSAIS